MLDRAIPRREIIVRGPSTIRHLTVSPLVQLVVLCAVVGMLAWGAMGAYIYANYEDIIHASHEELSKSKEEYRKLVAEVSAYNSQIELISKKIEQSAARPRTAEEEDGAAAAVAGADSAGDNKATVVRAVRESLGKFFSPGAFVADEDAEVSEMDRDRLRGDVMWLSKKLDALSSGKTRGGAMASTETLDVELSKAELQRDLALSEARNLRNKVVEMESLVGEMQKTQVIVFNKVANLAEDGIGALEKRLSGVKDAMGKVGLGFEGLVAKVNLEYRDETAIGGPFIPVSLSTPALPDLKNEILNVSLTNLNGYVSRWQSLSMLEEKLPIGRPVDKIRLTSRFGVRSDPFNKKQAIHEGLDFGGMRGEPIYATSGGKVIYAGLAGSFGYMVEIDHGLGIRSRYAHLNSIEVKRGEKVSTGQKIATMGNSGRSTGVHLHYEIRMRGTPMDPLNFVRIERNVSKKY